MRKTITATPRGLMVDSFPYKLYQKAKRAGTWNPADIDFTQDAKDWQMATDSQRQSILRLLSQFQAGEEAVTLDLLPLIMAIAKEGRIEEEMFLTTFLFEEAKHTEFFRTVLDAICLLKESWPRLATFPFTNHWKSQGLCQACWRVSGT